VTYILVKFISKTISVSKQEAVCPLSIQDLKMDYADFRSWRYPRFSAAISVTTGNFTYLESAVHEAVPNISHHTATRYYTSYEVKRASKSNPKDGQNMGRKFPHFTSEFRDLFYSQTKF
jgi:hypothetical protein